MIPLVFTLAAVLIAVAVALIVVDHRRSRSGGDSPAAAASPAPALDDESPDLDREFIDETGASETSVAEAGTDAEPDRSEATPPGDENSAAELRDTASFMRPRQRRESSEPARLQRRHLSGRKVRHLRKLWAQQRNATYSRVDHELPSYWQRTPNGDAKAVVSGFAFGREMHLADIGGTTTIAIRRSVVSDETIEVRRGGSTDLRPVAKEAGLIVAATTPEIVHRIFDQRASRMLVDVHPAICRMWCEGAWSLAQLIDGTAMEDWDGALVTLSAFSDIARRLPPGKGETVTPDASQWDPTRAQLADKSVEPSTLAEAGNGRAHLQVVPNTGRDDGHHDASARGAAAASRRLGEETPLDVEEIADSSSLSHTAAGETQPTDDDATIEAHGIDSSSWRPTRDAPLDPTALPTRSTARKMGSDVGDREEIGNSGQPIPALGEDPEHSRIRSERGRVVRLNERPASIFTDSTPNSASDSESAAVSDPNSPDE